MSRQSRASTGHWFAEPVMTALFCAVTLFFMQAAVANAQSMDDLFNDPDTTANDTAADSGMADNGAAETGATDATAGTTSTADPDQEEQPPVVDIAALTTSPTKVSGSFSGTAGIGLGFKEWPGSHAAGERTACDLREYSILYSSAASVTVDSRPASYVRFHSTLTSTLSSGTLRYGTPSVSELFVDYILANRYFFRVGNYSMTWGNGRLFDNPANLVDRVDEGAAFRVSTPVWRGGSFTGLVYSRSAWAPEDSGYRAFAWAGQLESTMGPLTAELSGHYKDGEPAGGALGLTVGRGELTVTAEGVYNVDLDNPWGTNDSYQALGNFFWESSNRAWSIAGEYQYDDAATKESGGRHLMGVAIATPSLKTGDTGDWRPGVRWKHSIDDSSGEVVTGMKGTVAPRLSLSIGLPVIYGTPGTYFREALASTTGLDTDEEGVEDQVPVDNVVMVLLAVSLSLSF